LHLSYSPPLIFCTSHICTSHILLSKVRKNTRDLRFFVFFPEKLGSCFCFVFSPTCGPAFGRSAHVRKPRAARQPPRFRPAAPPCPPPSPPRRTPPPAYTGGPDRRFTGIDLGVESIALLCTIAASTRRF
jgi:hypothetical protein